MNANNTPNTPGQKVPTSGTFEKKSSNAWNFPEKKFQGLELSAKILLADEMARRAVNLRAAGWCIVFTNGCFDILHRGHIDYLDWARRQGDLLVVGLNSDASVRRYKGDLRPVNSQDDRAFVLAALACVDYVVIFDEDEPADLIARIIPGVLVKGADWAHYVSGREIVEQHGGRVALAEMTPGKSTTGTIGKILEAYGKGQP